MLFSWIEISKKSLLSNISQIKKRLPKKTKTIFVVKANAYGHGLLQVVNVAKNKVDYFAVFTLEDAIFLRQKNIKNPILMLGRIFPKQVDLAIKNNIEVTVSTFDILEKVKKKLMVHICVDSGLGRDGFVGNDLKKVVKLLKNSPLQVKGLYSHFASADDSTFDDYTKKQAAELLRWKKEFSFLKVAPLIHYCATSGVFVKGLSQDFDMVRIGIGFYGLWPSEEVKKREEKQTKLTPILSWKALISEVKFVKKGSAISYNSTHVLKRDSKLAIIPIGYFDGVPRVASNKGFVIVNGVKVPQIGRVTMNLIILDVTDVKNVKIGDVATIIGRQKNVEVSADDWGNFSQSSSYEVLTRINSAIKRMIYE